MGLRILVADDDIDVCLLVAEVMRRRGHLVTTVADGEQALAAALADPPDVAVVDLMMPGLDGYRLTAALASDARTAHVPVVVLTARAGGIDRKFAFKSGARAFVRKPFAAQDLAEQVSAAAANGAHA
jgi:two-component system, OmpR family, response regulator MtrA